MRELRSRRTSGACAVFAVLAVCAAGILWAGSVEAVPGDIAPGSKLVFSWNLLGFPAGQEYQGGCGSGHRIFVNRGANHAQILLTNDASGWWIEDCNATADNRAVLHTSGAGIYDVYVRILGKPGGRLFICADSATADGEALCLLGTIDLTRGKNSKFMLQPSALFDASLFDILWNVDTNADYRIAQFRVYQRP